MNNKKNGFTLLELMVTLAVAAVLITSGVPAFGRFIENSRETTAMNTLVSALSLARSEAVKRNRDIEVCASSTRTSCTGAWRQGWLVYYTGSGGKIRPLRAADGIDGDFTLTAKTKGGGAFANVKFMANGLSDTDGTFTLCDNRGASSARAIAISKSGGAQASTDVGYALDGTTPLICP